MIDNIPSVPTDTHYFPLRMHFVNQNSCDHGNNSAAAELHKTHGGTKETNVFIVSGVPSICVAAEARAASVFPYHSYLFDSHIIRPGIKHHL